MSKDESHKNFFLLKAILFPVIVVPSAVIAMLLFRGNESQRIYNRALQAANSGNYQLAALEFERAAALGHAESACDLALLYQAELLPAKNRLQKIRQCLMQGALNGSMNAEYELGKLAESGPEPDMLQAAMHYRRAALGGHVQAQTAMGRLHEAGLGVNQSALLAKEFYQQAAQSGSAEACTALAKLYLSGKLDKVDHKQARKYLLQAAKQKYPESLTMLGYIYQQADDNELAGKYYRQAAELNDPAGLVNYGDYLAGQNNSEEALTYYEQAARQNYSPALHRLGMYYFQQSPPDYQQARKYFEKAASCGNPASWINLGIMAELGHTGKTDLKRAAECYSMAEKLGHPDAAERLRTLRSK